MIPTLHYFEICLRNRIAHVIHEHYAANWLMHPPRQLLISEQDKQKIAEITSRVSRGNRRPAIHDDIVAQMTFGFWCSFFHRKYDPVIWHRKGAIKMAFPHLPRANRNRVYIEARLFKIKEIRNRIAHHEPIWNQESAVLNAHMACHELIQAMSEDAASMLKTIDRFPAVCYNAIPCLGGYRGR
jgi:hypothetical protein